MQNKEWHDPVKIEGDFAGRSNEKRVYEGLIHSYPFDASSMSALACYLSTENRKALAEKRT